MDIKNFWRKMTPSEKRSFASEAGTTIQYIERHLIQSPPSRVPTPRLIDGLYKASKKTLSKRYLYKHFYEHDKAVKPRSKVAV